MSWPCFNTILSGEKPGESGAKVQVLVGRDKGINRNFLAADVESRHSIGMCGWKGA